MLHRSEEGKAALLRRLAARARRLAGRAKKRDPGRFVRQYYANVAPEDMLGVSEDTLLRGALSAWTYLQTRTARKAKIRVFNPGAGRRGWAAEHTVIEVVNDDMPFLVDSVTAELNRRNLAIHLLIHPVIRVRRSKTGRLTALCEPDDEGKGTQAESVMHIEINQQPLPEMLREIRRGLARVLDDVRAAVDDWRAMRVRVADAIAELDSAAPPLPPEEIEEAKAFLRWIEDDHFTFLGYREYSFAGRGAKARLRVEPRSGLGILRESTLTLFEGLQDEAVLPPDITDFVRRPQVVMVSKANRRSTVHRAIHLDAIGIKKFDRNGQVVGERLFAGLFTSDVYSHAVSEIPMLRRKVKGIIARSGFAPNSHDGKALMHILETLPRDELLQVDADDLLATAMGILHLQERQRIALFVHRDPFGRHVSCLVYVPRDRYDTRLRRAMQAIIEEGFGGVVTAFYTQVTDEALARLHFIVKTTPGVPAPLTVEEIERRLAEAGRDWREDLGHSLIAEHGEARGLDLFRIHGEAFPVGYRERFNADEAVFDVARVEAAMATGEVGMNLYRPAGAAENEVRFKLYHRERPLPLSDVLPMLENMGLKVIDEIPHQIAPRDCRCVVWIHDFGMVMRSGAAIDLAAVKGLFEDAFARVWAGETADDGFNKLVLGAGLAWRQVVVLRTYCKFLLQAAIPFSQAYMEETFDRYPRIARLIVELFETLFDPEAQDKAAARAARLRRRIDKALDTVRVLDEDRILRRFVNAVDSTLRTNYFQRAPDGAPKPYLAIKLNSQTIEDLPLPRPHVEIFIHSPRVDAAHLRGGPVARGGIRWSDRREDFRTEILGLMKAQMTKNAVIIPVGAKGGFVVKQPPAAGGREAVLAEGIACYRTMMRGMLDITDNLAGGRVVPPEGVVRRDGDDPYLVVAADKGTASFSDIANAIAAEYGFWLGDAFASGGSAGYDHKAMGITARGAWESIKRHFREMGLDVETTPFTCVGIGDMSGDVFGNGMLCSRQIRLVGAFNHLHIFVDPDPDPQASYRERRRLFGLARSSWSDYRRKLISRGGGVFERTAKAIKVTPEMRTLFGLSAKATVTPNELIRAMLAAPVDLLWFGGIGTYVKARRESHAEVGDRANDAVRVDARDLRARVVGEGANLGVTQRGRVEYALGGGRINTDFIDNSAGVDCSDHEVNIKILLGQAIAAGKLTLTARNRLLVEMTDEVAALVLMDNYRQSMALTNAAHQSVALLDEHARFMHALERAGLLNRAVEFLPDDEALADRRAEGRGLVRPELAVLLTYAKIELFHQLLASDVPDDPYLVRGLGLYFPAPIRQRFAAFLPEHRLKREIIATYVANTLVNRTGPSFIHTMAERTGAASADIARAYLVCRQVFKLAELWAGVEALDNSVPAAVQTEMHLEILHLIRRGTLWFLRNGPRPLVIDPAVAAFAPGIALLDAALDEILSPGLKTAREKKAAAYVGNRVPAALAQKIANLDALAPGCDIVRIASGGQFAADAVARIYYGLGARFGFDWLRAAAAGLGEGDEWQRMAVAAIVDDLYAYQTALTTKVLDMAGATQLAPAVIDAWAAAHRHGVERIQALIGDLRTASAVDLAMLAVVNREIRALIAS